MATVQSGDLVVFFNHRAEGMRQLVRSLCLPDGSGGAKPVVDTVSIVEYDRSFNLPAAFRHEPERNPIVRVLAAHDISAVKITEDPRLPRRVTGCR